MKVCTKCHIEKDQSEFHKDNRRNKVSSICLECVRQSCKIRMAKYRERHRQLVNKRARDYYHRLKKAGKIVDRSEYQKRYRERNSNKLKANNKKRYNENKVEKLKHDKEYYNKNKCEILKRVNEYKNKNTKAVNKYQKKYHVKARKELGKSYLKKLIKGQLSANVDVSPELIEIKKFIIKIKRHVKENKKANKQPTRTPL